MYGNMYLPPKLICVLGICLITLPMRWSKAEDAATRTMLIEQRLDHFDTANQEQFQQRLLIKDYNHAHDAPLFLLIGGHESIGNSSLTNTHWGDLARQHNGTLVMIEHRHYGESIPASDPDLKYLNSRQSIYDIDHVIKHLKKTDTRYANSKVLMAGTGYGGALVVWYKRLFPNNIAGGWASSPLLYAQLGIPEYLESVGKLFRDLGSDACYERIKLGIEGIEELMAEKRYEHLKAQLNICRRFNFEDEKDVATLFATIAYQFECLVIKANITNIKENCNQLTSYNQSDTDALIEFLRSKNKNTTKCVNYQHNNHVENIKYSKCSVAYYQICNEFGHLSASDGPNHPFGTKFPKTHIAQICADLFNQSYTVEQITEKVAKTNDMFGGREPNVDGIYMTYGTLDPLAQNGPTKGAYKIPNAFFSVDFESVSKNDNAEVTETKNNIQKLVTAWLETNTNTNTNKTV